MCKWMAMVPGLMMLVSSVASWANPVEDQMKLISRHYRNALNADTAEVFRQELTAMKEAALTSQQYIPAKLKNQSQNSVKLKDYRHGFDILIGEIDAASTLAANGKMVEAKKMAEGFKSTRNEYHKKYK